MHCRQASRSHSVTHTSHTLTLTHAPGRTHTAAATNTHDRPTDSIRTPQSNDSQICTYTHTHAYTHVIIHQSSSVGQEMLPQKYQHHRPTDRPTDTSLFPPFPLPSPPLPTPSPPAVLCSLTDGRSLLYPVCIDGLPVYNTPPD